MWIPLTTVYINLIVQETFFFSLEKSVQPTHSFESQGKSTL